MHWSIYKVPDHFEVRREKTEEFYWEIQRYLELALKANPTVLETLWTPIVLYKTNLAEKLLSIRRSFLSKRVFQTYSGYAMSQFKKMIKSVQKGQKYHKKNALHLVRILISGINILKEGEPKISFNDHRDDLLRIKRGQMDFYELKEWVLDLEKGFNEAYSRTKLPDEPDYETVNKFLIKARKFMIKEK
jgi:hypothetical protein